MTTRGTGKAHSGGKTAKSGREHALLDYARLVSGMMHDFRAPLGSIVGSASVLDSYAGSLDEELRARLCAGIADQAHRLDRLLAALGAIARARAGLLISEQRPCELNEILHGLSARMRHHPEQPVDIAVQRGEIFLDTDPDAIQTLLLLMLDLAYVFAGDESPVKVSISGQGRSARISMESRVGAADGSRLQKLLDEQFSQPAEGVRPSTDAVFLAAITEVVHSLGGRLTIGREDAMDRLTQSISLPAQSTSSR